MSNMSTADSDFTTRELQEALDDLSSVTARSISSDYSFVSDYTEWEDAEDGGDNANIKDRDRKAAADKIYQQAEPKPSTQFEWSATEIFSSMEGSDEWKRDDKKDPPSFYQLAEMNKGPVKMVTRLAAVPSQYQLAEMRDYPALQANPYMLKLATSKCIINSKN